MTFPPLLVERASPSDAALHLQYNDSGVVYVQLKNNVDTDVSVERVTLLLNAEGGIRQPFPVEVHKTLGPGERSHAIALRFKVDLTLRAHTNTFTLDIRFLYKGESFTYHFTPVTNNYLILDPLPPHRHFFLSHRDPVDTSICERVDKNLRKAGLEGWYAERYKQPGVLVWEKKISEAIEACVALVVVWTASAAMKPEEILREVGLARTAKKHVIVFAEPSMKLHPDLDVRPEYTRVNFHDELELAQAIADLEATYRAGSFDGPP